MRRVVERILPSGKACRVHPFHICLKGTGSSVLCRDEEDYDVMVKIMAVAALRKDVIIVIYTVVSNHFHVVVLAESQSAADSFAEEVKRIYSMWFSRKYGETGVLRRVQSTAIWLDDNNYVRNALAYVPRNALDNGYNVDEYRWSGYSAMFRGRKASDARPVDGSDPDGAHLPENMDGSPSGDSQHQERFVRGRRVSSLSSRETEGILHTGMDLRHVSWLLDDDNCLISESFCDRAYLEQAFEGSQAYFLRVIGSVNVAEMDHRLVEAPRVRELDGEMLKEVEELSVRWFGTSLSELSIERKLRLLPYLFRTRRTSSAQLARVLGLSREVSDRAVERLKGRRQGC